MRLSCLLFCLLFAVPGWSQPVAQGDDQTLVKAIKEREEQRDTLTRQIASLASAERAGRVDWTMVEKQLRAKLDEWRQLLQRHVAHRTVGVAETNAQHQYVARPPEMS